MTPVTIFKGKRAAVFGLGASGISAAKALIAGGADVAVWDDGEKGREKAAAEKLPLQDLKSADWTKFDALVLAPGVPLTHPEPHWTVKAAHAAQRAGHRRCRIVRAASARRLRRTRRLSRSPAPTANPRPPR